MIVLQKVLHTSRPIVPRSARTTLARNLEKIMGLKKGACKVTVKKKRGKQACATNDVPHCHYAITMTYDETQKA